MTKKVSIHRGSKPGLTREIGERICAHIAGGESLNSLLKSDGTLPCRSTVMLWVVKGEAGDEDYSWFSEMYLMAQQASGHSHADMIVSLAEQAMMEGVNPNAVRVAMDGMKWAAERMHSKRYTIKSQGTGKDGAFIVQLTPADIAIV